MQPETINPKANSPKHLRLKVLLALACILIVVVAGVFFVRNHKSAQQNLPYEKGLHNQSFSALNNFVLLGTKPGSGMTMELPQQYHLAFQTDNKDQASLSDSTQGPTSYFQGSVHLASVYAAGSKNLQQTYENVYSKPESSSAKTTTGVVQQFLKQRFSPLYDLKFSAPTAFTSTNIKAAAWQMDISAAPKDSQHAGSPLEAYKGKIVFAVGKSTTYYFAAYTTYYNWDNNSATWTKVFNSLKIDQ